MKKYKIEDDIDFYAELNNISDCESDTENNNDSNININIGSSINTKCLITHEPLIHNFITLECKHSFNYLPLYKDICSYKKICQNMGAHNNLKLKLNQIRCPYCRNIQDGLLPYIDIEGINKVHGVNCFDKFEFYKNFNFHNIPFSYYEKCQHSENCCIKGVYYVIDKHLCYSHVMMEKKKTLQEMKEIEKEKKKKLLKEIKESNKKKKEELKIKEKEDKKQKMISEGHVCKEILKSGKNKGQQCGSINIYQSNLCKRHYSMMIANTSNTNNTSNNIET